MSAVLGQTVVPLLMLEGTSYACALPWRCYACDGDHGIDDHCAALLDAWWSLMKEPGDFGAKRWARASLGLDDEPEQLSPRGIRTSHHHGWAEVDGEWRCVQDFYVAGTASLTGCGATWDPGLKASTKRCPATSAPGSAEGHRQGGGMNHSTHAGSGSDTHRDPAERTDPLVNDPGQQEGAARPSWDEASLYFWAEGCRDEGAGEYHWLADCPWLLTSLARGGELVTSDTPPVNAWERERERMTPQQRSGPEGDRWSHDDVRWLCRMCDCFWPQPTAIAPDPAEESCSTCGCYREFHEGSFGLLNTGCSWTAAEADQFSDDPDDYQVTLVHCRCDGYRHPRASAHPSTTRKESSGA